MKCFINHCLLKLFALFKNMTKATALNNLNTYFYKSIFK